jgi:S1-C subfamily serine protease/cytochrome c-type biogenesis protein CcmH/NrfG
MVWSIPSRTVITAILGGVFVAGVPLELKSQSEVIQQESTGPAKQPSPLTPQELFANVSGSVFVVEVLDSAGTSVAQGSGVTIGPDRLVTNKHVVIEGEKLKVSHGDKTWSAHILQLAPHADLCLLEVEGLTANELPTIRRLSSIMIGERVYAIGAPRGLELTLSDGLVSGIREDESGPVIQTSAPISPGSSGGGLFDNTGRLIGITTFTIQNSQELNFAVPALEISALGQQPQRATEEAWIAVGDQFMKSAVLSEIPPPIPIDPAAQQMWVQQMKRQMVPLRIQWRKAVRAYREALQIETNNSEVWMKLGTAYADLEDKENASNAFRKAVVLEPNNTTLWVNIGDAYKKMSDSEHALDAYKQAIRIKPIDSALWVTLAEAYLPNQRQQAIEALEKAQDLGPSDGGVWWRIGLGWKLLEKYKQAETSFEKAVQLDPLNSMYLLSLGQFYVYRRDRSKAKQVYERLKALDPSAAELLGQQIGYRWDR